jgi:hypothetical protein
VCKLKYWTDKPIWHEIGFEKLFIYLFLSLYCRFEKLFIFLPADPLQSFHNNWIHALTLIIEVEKVIAIKLFQAIVDQCAKNTT